MKADSAVSGKSVYSPLLRMLLVGLLVDLLVLVLVLVAHGATASSLLLKPAQFLTVALGLLGASSLVVGVVYAWMAFPQHRRILLAVLLITLATFLAHLYVINSPPASVPGTLVNTVGTTNQDGYITVSSSLQGQILSVNVTVSGGSAIAGIQVSAPGALLLGSGLVPAPSYYIPLEPSGSVTGTWTVTAPVSSVNVSYQYLSCYDAKDGWYGCIMDESFYVPEAMGLLAGQACSTDPSVGYRCHMEHPPLSPLLVAGGMALFGEFSTLGWRIMPALLGTLSIPVLFAIAWKVSGRKDIALLAALFLGLDVNFFSLSSAALLDIPMIFFGLLALLVYVMNLRVWKLNKFVLAGVLVGVAALAKETAILIAFAIFTYNLLFGEGDRRKRLRTTVVMGVIVLLTFSAGLQTFDSIFSASSPPAHPICGPTVISYFYQQVDYILCYGSSLIGGGWTGGVFGTYITPLDWLVYYRPVPYVLANVSVCTSTAPPSCTSYVSLGYYGVTNLIETWTTWIWAPLAAYLLYMLYRRKSGGLDQFVEWGKGLGSASTASGEVKFAGLALIWFLWNYLSYVVLYLGGRVTYPFYFTAAVPAVAMGASFLLTRKQVPRWLMLVFVVAAFVFFLVFFPVKDFLPVSLRSIIPY